MDDPDLRIRAVQRAIIELSAVIGPQSRARALAPLLDELEHASGDERLVLQEAIDLIKDGKLLGDVLAMDAWIRRISR